MNRSRDPDLIIASWLEDGPTQLPDTTRRAIVNAIPSISQKQARGWRWRAQRSGLPGLALVALTAAAAVVVAAVILSWQTAPAPNVGEEPKPPPASPVTPSATAAVSAQPIDTTDWVSFTSARYPFEFRHPPDWHVQRSLTDWVLGEDRDRTPHYATYDQVLAPGNYPDFNGHAMPLPEGMTEEEWTVDYAASMAPYCYPTREQWAPTFIDGRAAQIAYGGCFNYAEAIAFVDGWAYVFSVEDTSPPGDPQLLAAFLSTVRFTTLTSSWIDFGSAVHGYSMRVPSTWSATGATRPWAFGQPANSPGDETMDVIRSPGDGPWVTISSQAVPDGMSAEDWIASVASATATPGGSACFPSVDSWASSTVSGLPALFYGGTGDCGTMEVVVVSDRAYLFTAYPSQGGDPGGVVFNPDVLSALLSTATFVPDQALSAPHAPGG